MFDSSFFKKIFKLFDSSLIDLFVLAIAYRKLVNSLLVFDGIPPSLDTVKVHWSVGSSVEDERCWQDVHPDVASLALLASKSRRHLEFRIRLAKIRN